MTTLRILYHEMTAYGLTIYHEMSLNKSLTSHILSVTSLRHLPLARQILASSMPCRSSESSELLVSTTKNTTRAHRTVRGYKLSFIIECLFLLTFALSKRGQIVL